VASRGQAFGFRQAGLEEARRAVEEALGVALEMRDSSYWGVYYCRRRGPGTDIMLYENSVGEWHTPAHASFRVVLVLADDVPPEALLARPDAPVRLERP
jgi:hypothetical protein